MNRSMLAVHPGPGFAPGWQPPGRPCHVLEGSPGAGRSPRGPVADWASRQRCLRLCWSAQDCGGLTAWPSAPLTTAQPSGLRREGREPHAGPGQQWTLDSRPHALMFLPPREDFGLRTWSYFCADRSKSSLQLPAPQTSCRHLCGCPYQRLQQQQ